MSAAPPVLKGRPSRRPEALATSEFPEGLIDLSRLTRPKPEASLGVSGSVERRTAPLVSVTLTRAVDGDARLFLIAMEGSGKHGLKSQNNTALKQPIESV